MNGKSETLRQAQGERTKNHRASASNPLRRFLGTTLPALTELAFVPFSTSGAAPCRPTLESRPPPIIENLLGQRHLRIVEYP
jgi:hypothetical protein